MANHCTIEHHLPLLWMDAIFILNFLLGLQLLYSDEVIVIRYSHIHYNRLSPEVPREATFWVYYWILWLELSFSCQAAGKIPLTRRCIAQHKLRLMNWELSWGEILAIFLKLFWSLWPRLTTSALWMRLWWILTVIRFSFVWVVFCSLDMHSAIATK